MVNWIALTRRGGRTHRGCRIGAAQPIGRFHYQQHAGNQHHQTTATTTTTTSNTYFLPPSPYQPSTTTSWAYTSQTYKHIDDPPPGHHQTSCTTVQLPLPRLRVLWYCHSVGWATNNSCIALLTRGLYLPQNVTQQSTTNIPRQIYVPIYTAGTSGGY